MKKMHIKLPNSGNLVEYNENIIFSRKNKKIKTLNEKLNLFNDNINFDKMFEYELKNNPNTNRNLKYEKQYINDSQYRTIYDTYRRNHITVNIIKNILRYLDLSNEEKIIGYQKIEGFLFQNDSILNLENMNIWNKIRIVLTKDDKHHIYWDTRGILWIFIYYNFRDDENTLKYIQNAIFK